MRKDEASLLNFLLRAKTRRQIFLAIDEGNASAPYLFRKVGGDRPHLYRTLFELEHAKLIKTLQSKTGKLYSFTKKGRTVKRLLSEIKN